MSKAQEQIKTMASSVLKVCLGAFQESSTAMPPSVTTPSLGNLVCVTTKAVECIGMHWMRANTICVVGPRSTCV